MDKKRNQSAKKSHQKQTSFVNRVDNALLNAQLTIKQKALDATDRHVAKVANSPDGFRKLCNEFYTFIGITGTTIARASLLDGLPKDLRKDVEVRHLTYEQIQAKYHDEPMFAKILERLHIGWDTFDQLAREACGMSQVTQVSMQSTDHGTLQVEGTVTRTDDSTNTSNHPILLDPSIPLTADEFNHMHQRPGALRAAGRILGGIFGKDNPITNKKEKGKE